MTTGNPPAAAPSPGEFPRLALLVANLGWTVLCLGGYRPETLVVTCSLTVALVLVHLLVPSRTSRLHPALWPFAAFVAYAAANVLWVTPVAWLGWREWFTWAQPLAVFWVVLTGLPAASSRRLLAASLAILAAVSGLLACYQHFGHLDWLMLHRRQDLQYAGRASGPFGIPNSLGGLMILLLPAILYSAADRSLRPWQRAVFALAAAFAAAGLVFSVSRGAWIALALALVVWPLFFGTGSLARRLALAVGVLAAVVLAGAALFLWVPLVHARLTQLVQQAGEYSRPILWRGALGIFREHPVWGGGASAFDLRFEAFRPEGFNDDPQWAHNDYLNTLCDYGLVGFVLAGAGVGLVAWRLRAARGRAAAYTVGLLAFSFQLFVEFHFKIPAMGMAAAIVAALAMGSVWPAAAAGPMNSAQRLVRCGAAIGVVALYLGLLLPLLRAETLRYHAREQLDRWSRAGTDLPHLGTAVDEVRTSLVEATRIYPGNGQAWSDLAFADSLAAFARKDQTIALGASGAAEARKAIVLCDLNAEFWERLCVSLDMQKRWTDGGDASVRVLTLAPARPDAWYYRGYHLSLSPITQDEAVAALGIALRLDPGYQAAQSLRQRLANGPPSASP
jgi:hypothetical protein